MFQNLFPIWLPHWPTWIVIVSRMICYDVVIFLNPVVDALNYGRFTSRQSISIIYNIRINSKCTGSILLLCCCSRLKLKLSLFLISNNRTALSLPLLCLPKYNLTSSRYYLLWCGILSGYILIIKSHF